MMNRLGIQNQPRPGMMPMMGYGFPMNPMMMPGQMIQMPQRAFLYGEPRPPSMPMKGDEEKTATTVFVGNISEKVPDSIIKQMLNTCGFVLSWKRVQGANGKLQAFGFCEFADPDASLRAIRILHEYSLLEKKLTVKVDGKTEKFLEEYKNNIRNKDESTKISNRLVRQKQREEDREEGEQASEEEDNSADDLDSETAEADKVTKGAIAALVKDLQHTDLVQDRKSNFDITKPQVFKRHDRDAKLPVVDMPDDYGVDVDYATAHMSHISEVEKEIVAEEIVKFRQTHRAVGDTDSPPQDEDNQRRMEEEKRNTRERLRREFERREESEAERKRQLEKERDRDRKRKERALRHSSKRSHTEDRERSDSPTTIGGAILDDDEREERKRIERKLREKETSYQERLRKWVVKEKKMLKRYRIEEEREVDRIREQAKEAKRLSVFLQEYTDHKDDLKFYKGVFLERRLSDHRREHDLDSKDRHRELMEIEEVRKRLTGENKLKEDIEQRMEQLKRDVDRHLKTPPPSKRFRLSPVPVPMELPLSRKRKYSSSSSAESLQEGRRPYNKKVQKENKRRKDDQEDIPVKNAVPQSQQGFLPAFRPKDALEPPVVALRKSSPPVSSSDDDVDFEEDSPPVYKPPKPVKQEPATKRPKSPHRAVNVEKAAMPKPPSPPHRKPRSPRRHASPSERRVAPTHKSESPTRKQHLRLENTKKREEAAKVVPPKSSSEDKRKTIKQLIERIPTTKDALFNHTVCWEQVDQQLMDKRIRPWVNKKIVEYIGDEEPTLVDFICQKLNSKSPARTVLDDLKVVLDEEAEVFVVKMWRLLIYETEAKKHGVSK